MADLSRYRPFGMDDQEFEEMRVLQDGVPQSLKKPLIAWLLSQLIDPRTSSLRDNLGHEILARTKINLDEPITARRFERDVQMLLDQVLSPQEMLRLTDYLLFTRNPSIKQNAPTGLIDIMSMASSKWIPTWDGKEWRLLERVPKGVQTAVESTIRSAGVPGALLQLAWSSAYGLSPNGPESYRMSVKAVETAGANCVIPKKHDASLGDVIGVIKANPKWTLPFANKPSFEDNNQQTLVHLMQTLWQGQHDRHLDSLCSVKEARAAVMSASTLVAWFTSGAVTKRD